MTPDRDKLRELREMANKARGDDGAAWVARQDLRNLLEDPAYILALLDALDAAERERDAAYAKCEQVAMDWPLTAGMSAEKKAASFSIAAAIRALATRQEKP